MEINAKKYTCNNVLLNVGIKRPLWYVEAIQPQKLARCDGKESIFFCSSKIISGKSNTCKQFEVKSSSLQSCNTKSILSSSRNTKHTFSYCNSEDETYPDPAILEKVTCTELLCFRQCDGKMFFIYCAF